MYWVVGRSPAAWATLFGMMTADCLGSPRFVRRGVKTRASSISMVRSSTLLIALINLKVS